MSLWPFHEQFSSCKNINIFVLYRKWNEHDCKRIYIFIKFSSFIQAVSFLFYSLLAASLLVCSVANLALLSTNISKSTSVPSVDSAVMSSQSVVLETTAGWLTSANAVRTEIPVGLASGRNPPSPLTLTGEIVYFTVRYWEHYCNSNTGRTV